MPLYEYECESCENRFERIQKFSDAPVEICPQCGGPVRKLLSSPAIQFKGSGWYVTDYAKKSSPESGKGGTPKTGETPKSDSAAPASGSSGSSSTADSSKGSSPKKD